MPNHFHFLVIPLPHVQEPSGQTTWSRPTANQGLTINPLSRAIATLLSSYTRAIQKQQNISGSLFQQKTKAKCLSDEKNANYPFICLNYIHQNPMKAGLVKRMEEWEFSSFRDYAGHRNGTLCNRDVAKQSISIDEKNFMETSYAVINEALIEKLW